MNGPLGCTEFDLSVPEFIIATSAPVEFTIMSATKFPMSQHIFDKVH